MEEKTILEMFETYDIVLGGIDPNKRIVFPKSCQDEEDFRKFNACFKFYGDLGIHWTIAQLTFKIAKHYFDKPFSGWVKVPGYFYVRRSRWEDLNRTDVVMILAGLTISPEKILEMKLFNKVPVLPRSFKYRTRKVFYDEMDLDIEIIMTKNTPPKVDIHFTAYLLLTPENLLAEIKLLPEGDYNYLELRGLTFEEV